MGSVLLSPWPAPLHILQHKMRGTVLGQHAKHCLEGAPGLGGSPQRVRQEPLWVPEQNRWNSKCVYRHKALQATVQPNAVQIAARYCFCRRTRPGRSKFLYRRSEPRRICHACSTCRHRQRGLQHPAKQESVPMLWLSESAQHR